MSLAATGAAIVTFYVVAIVLPPAIALVAAQLVLAGVGARDRRRGRPGAGAAGRALRRRRRARRRERVAAQPDAGRRARPDRPRTASGSSELVSRPTLPYALATLALLPRGVRGDRVPRRARARRSRRDCRRGARSLVSAAVFSAYHLSPVQAVPTFTLGLAARVDRDPRRLDRADDDRARDQQHRRDRAVAARGAGRLRLARVSARRDRRALCVATRAAARASCDDGRAVRARGDDRRGPRARA